MSAASGKLVIIGGMPRSGTNLVRRIIGSHSQIAIPHAEFVFFRKHSEGRSLAEIFANPRLKFWKLDFTDLLALSPRDAYVTALTRYADSVSKPICGEKTPLNEFYLDLIDAWLTDFDVRFVHMIRDPLDVVSSYKKRPFFRERVGESPEFVASVARNWHRSAAIGLARERSRPSAHRIVRFEALTADPAATAAGIAEFIGVPFEEARMLNFEDFKTSRDNTSYPDADDTHQTDHRVFKPGRRATDLSSREVAAVAHACGELARALGYEHESYRCSQPEPPRVGAGLKLRDMLARVRTRP